jgi:hypothetical protein
MTPFPEPPMRWFAAVPLLFALSACSWEKRVKHLDDAEFDHYYALKVYMDDAERKAYLKLKTRDERDKYLQAFEMPGTPPRRLWDLFYQFDEHIRDKIVAGEVQEGWTVEMMMMAWGNPKQSKRLTGRKAVRSWSYIYKFEEQEDGAVLVWEPGSKTEYKAVRLFEREVIVDDDKIVEIRKR